MQLPPALVKTTADVLKIALEPLAKRVGAGLLALVEAGLRGRFKSHEERLLDVVEGEIAMNDLRRAAVKRLKEIASDPDLEHQRILARAAVVAVRGDFVMPALEIAGPIFRDSEFERTDSPIWEMWKELLARACDSSRLDEAHPAYMEIIKQLSVDEAKLLSAIAPWQVQFPANDSYRPMLSSDRLEIIFPKHLYFYLGHLTALGLIDVVASFDSGYNIVMIDDVHFRMLSPFGRGFMEAVTSTPSPSPAPP